MHYEFQPLGVKDYIFLNFSVDGEIISNIMYTDDTAIITKKYKKHD